MRVPRLLLLRSALLGLACVGAAPAAPAAVGLGGPPAKAEGEDAGPPPVFTRQTFADALAKSRGGDGRGKILIAKFTAEWCGPCKMMDRTTWREPRVEKWVNDHGWAVQVDVDVQRDAAQTQRVRAMPTTIVYRDGEPLDRKVGYLNAEQLLAFLDGALAPRPAPADPAEAKAADAARRDGLGMQDRMSEARELIDAGRFEEATAEHLWLWRNIVKRQPSMIGVRGSFLASQMERLASEHAPAKTVFKGERDAAEDRLKGDAKTFEDLDDWIVLNDVVGDQDRTLAWFDRVKADPDVGPTFRRVAFRLDRLLESRGRYADMGLIVDDPVRELNQAAAMRRVVPPMPNLDPETKRRLENMHATMFRDRAATLYAAMLAGRRDEEAAKVARAAVTADDTGELRAALVGKALEAKAARKDQLRLLDDAQTKGADVQDLRTRLQAALAGAGA